MEEAILREIKSNLFAYAHAAVWKRFPWHRSQGKCDAWKKHSSQALAIDVFGTLAAAPQEQRDLIMNSLASRLGIPEGGPWEIELEWLVPKELLGEPRPTQVDAVARGKRSLIFFEAKFTEDFGGPCSQTIEIPKGAHSGLTQCNGHYELQVNPVNKRSARCALTAKNILYWKFIPEVFLHLQADQDHKPCPFAHNYQLMRNVVACWAAARDLGRRPAFALAYAQGPELPTAQAVQSGKWSCFAETVKREVIPVEALSFQELLHLAVTSQREAGNDTGLWEELAGWVEGKIEKVCRKARGHRRGQ